MSYNNEAMTMESNNPLGDGPLDEQYAAQMQAMAYFLDEHFNGTDTGDARKVGFVLLVFPYNDHEGRCNYLSNGADRRDIATMMREQIKRFEEG